MIPIEDLECVCPKELHDGMDDIYRPFSRVLLKNRKPNGKGGNRRNLIWWMLGPKKPETFFDPNGCLCTLPQEIYEEEKDD
jgi:hypothetical protein